MWTHRYSWKASKNGAISTGKVQVGREYSNDEVFELAKRMSHGNLNGGTLVEVKCIEKR